MPGVQPLLDDDETSDDLKLWLPSELSQDDRAAWCLEGIPGLEFRFRYAQADDSLAEIRRLRRIVQGLLDQKAKHPSQSQRYSTRSKGVFGTFEARINRAVKRYRHARRALLALDPSEKLSHGWAQRFRVLEDADVRGPGRDLLKESDGTFQPSWIWLVPMQTSYAPGDEPPPKNPSTATGTNSSLDDPEVADAMRVHWAKCQARADRYEEEVTLTVEEMGRTLRYFEWKRSWWLSLPSDREQSVVPPPIEVQRGLYAYACRQAHVYETLITSFVNRWRRLLVLHGLGSDWLRDHPIAIDPLSARPSRGHRSQPVAEPDPTPVSDPSTQAGSQSSQSRVPVLDTDATDSPIESESENGDDSDYVIEEGEEFDFED